jgi:hypothetical protein
MATHSVIQSSRFPQAEAGSLSPRAPLSPLAAQKYYSDDGKRLLFDFINRFLGVEIIGFQQGFKHIPDQILFRSPANGSTLCVPCSVMLLNHEQAADVIQTKIRQNAAGFRA